MTRTGSGGWPAYIGAGTAAGKIRVREGAGREKASGDPRDSWGTACRRADRTTTDGQAMGERKNQGRQVETSPHLEDRYADTRFQDQTVET